MLKSIPRYVLATFMILVGIQHFMKPDPFVRIVPEYLPWHLQLVYVSGFFEVLGGVGLLIPELRRAAAWGLIALYVAVFPANVNMAINRLPFGESVPPDWVLWGRLPIQILLIWWVYQYTKEEKKSKTKKKTVKV